MILLLFFMDSSESAATLRRLAYDMSLQYTWNRFKELAEAVGNMPGISKGAVKIKLEDEDYNEPYLAILRGKGYERIETGPGALLRDLDGLEASYRVLLEWVLDKDCTGPPYAPSVLRFHANDLVGLLIEENARAKGRNYLSGHQLAIFNMLPKTALDQFKWLHEGTDPEEGVLLPRYFSDLLPVDRSASPREAFDSILGLDERIIRIMLEQESERIPRFAPEVHLQRAQILTTVPAMLNGFYDILQQYCTSQCFH